MQSGLDVKSIARDRGAMKALLERPNSELANVAQACGYLWRQGTVNIEKISTCNRRIKWLILNVLYWIYSCFVVPVPVICCIHGVW